MKLPNLPYVAIAKKVTSVVVGLGTSQIVKGVIANNTSPEKTVDKVTLVAATVVVSAMVSKATAKHTDAQIDELTNWWSKNVSSKFKNEEELEEMKTLEPTEIIAAEAA